MRKLVPLLAAAAALALPAAGAAGGSTSFADASGDTPAADITTVGVSNDDAGLISFIVSIPNRPALPSSMVVLVFLNTDQNTSTGAVDNDGAEYVLGYSGGEIELGKWNGSSFDFSTPPSLTSSYASGLTLKIAAADIGGVSKFDFYVAVDEHAADGTPQVDFAPDAGAGLWTYAVQITPPAVKPPVASKPAPKAKPKPKKPAPKKKKH